MADNINGEVNTEIENENVETTENSDSPQHENENEGKGSKKHNKKEKECRYKDGQILTFVNVRFPGNAKSFPFIVGKRKFSYGQKVVAMSDRGMTVGYINSFPYELPFDKSMLPIRSISKIATQEDLDQQKKNIDAEVRAEKICLRLIDKHQLNMVLTHVEIIQFGKKAVFYFNAPERVDFRGLVKDLVSELKMRIELRQISTRDRSAGLGAIGACGLPTCCSSFLSDYGNVSIKMAKNQNLTLLPGKINGVCGQIKCCIKFENKIYSEKRKLLPKEGSFIKTQNGDLGKVTKLHLLIEQFDMLTDEGKFRRYYLSEFDPDIETPKGWQFPDSFDHIVNETSEIIGTPPKKCCATSGCKKFETVYDSDNDSEQTEDNEQPEKPEVKAEQEKNNNDNRNHNRSRRSHKFNRKNRNNRHNKHKKPKKS